MKKLFILALLILNGLLATSAQAATVQVIASDVLATSGSFTTSPTGTVLTTAELTDIVTSDVGTFVMSNDSEAYIDLGFGGTQVITGNGADLIIYTVGNDYNFGLQAFDSSSSMISNLLYEVPGDGSSTAQDENGNDLCLMDAGSCVAAISATSINLFDTGLNEIADNTDISFIRLFIGTDANYMPGSAYPLFSMAEATHTAVVPLPLPVVLFSSGLVLLGWVARQKII